MPARKSTEDLRERALELGFNEDVAIKIVKYKDVMSMTTTQLKAYIKLVESNKIQQRREKNELKTLKSTKIAQLREKVINDFNITAAEVKGIKRAQLIESIINKTSPLTKKEHNYFSDNSS